MVDGNPSLLIDGGSNVCVMGELILLVDIVDIAPMAISVALEGAPSSFNNRITKQGLLPLTLSNGATYFQPCFYCANMVKTIISPATVIVLYLSNKYFYRTQQVVCKDPTAPGCLQFMSHDDSLLITFDCDLWDGLYYCNTDVFTVAHDPIKVQFHQAVALDSPDIWWAPSKFAPTLKA
jgi:hypothetical protein